MVRTVVLFDLDGTLVDTRPGIHRCADLALADVGLGPLDPARLTEIVGPPLRQAFELLSVPEELLDPVVTAYRRHYEEGGLYEFDHFPGVREALEALSSRGVRLAVSTSKITRYATLVLERAGFAGHFDVVLGAEPDGVRHSKAEVVADTLARLGDPTTSSTAMVGDRIYDADGARINGIDFVAVSWGYGSPDELRRAEPVATAGHPGELEAILLDTTS